MSFNTDGCKLLVLFSCIVDNSLLTHNTRKLFTFCSVFSTVLSCIFCFLFYILTLRCDNYEIQLRLIMMYLGFCCLQR